MEDQVEEIKSKIDIVNLVGQYVVLKKLGRHSKGLCPFHSEKTPSFTVNEEMGRYKCFGCGAGGDVIKFLMEIEGIEFREALERLAEKAGVKLVSRRREDGDVRQKMLEVLDLTARYYHWILTEGKSGEMARKYLAERKLSNKLIETFNIGFALPEWSGLTNYLIKKKGYTEDILIKTGLVSKRNDGQGVFDKFRGRIMFPLQDTGGKVVGFSGRILPELAKLEEPKYLNSPETELYHKGKMLFGFYQAKQAIRENKRAVLVEGQMDMISSFGAGVTETVAVGGTALTEDQVEMLARLAEKICFSLDADEAGTAAMKRSVEIAEKRGLGIKVVRITGGKDPDEIARNFPNKWKSAVEEAIDVYEFVMERAFDKNDKNTIEGIKKITEEVIPFLAKIENNVVREVWTKRLSERLGVEFRGVMAEIERLKLGRPILETKTIKQDEGLMETRIDKLTKRVIGSVLLRQSAKKKIRQWFENVSIGGSVGKSLIWLLNDPGNEDPSVVIAKAPAELKEVIAEAYLAEGDTEKENDLEVETVAIQLLREVLREKKRVLMEEMAMARKEENEKKEADLFEQLNELNKKESKLVALLG